ncbi:MAG TPA: sterol desaturase family protein [Gemmatimonadales bacterium]
MTTSEPDVATDLVATLRLGELTRSALFGTALLLGVVILVQLAERRQGVSSRRLLSKHFATDAAWALFYRSGVYVMFILSVVTNALGARLEFLRLELLPNMPSIIAVPIYLIVGDFVLYWIHRLQHAVPMLWAFHTVHHSQEQLNTLTQYRRHPLEMLYAQVVMFVVFVLILGIPMRTWIPLYAILVALQALQHAELNWRFGPGYPVVVSPVFHSIHHSTDPAHANRNFGAMFSFWDYVFGTAITHAPRPVRYGVPGLEMKESLLAHLVTPFGLLARQFAPRRPTREDPEGPKREVAERATLV